MACYRRHQAGEAGPCAPDEDERHKKGTVVNRKRVWEEVDDEKDDILGKVSEEQLGLLRRNDGVKGMVKDEELRDIIRRIDKASDPARELETWIGRDERFVEFVDEMLAVIGVRERPDEKKNDASS